MLEQLIFKTETGVLLGKTFRMMDVWRKGTVVMAYRQVGISY